MRRGTVSDVVERWLPVIDYEGLYEVSDAGQVRSVDRVNINSRGVSRHLKGVTLRATPTPGGYPAVSLSRGNVIRTHPLHRLVLNAFIGPRPDGLVVRHLNGDPTDNRLENLTYGTQAENCQDAIRHGRNAMLRKTHCKHGHELTGWAVIVNERGRKCRVCVYKSMGIAWTGQRQRAESTKRLARGQLKRAAS